MRGRLQLGAGPSAPLLGLFAGIGRQAFLFSAPGAVADVLPSVDYYYLRFGADARIPAGPLLLLAGAAYRHLQSRRAPDGATVPAAGDFGEHFPKASIAGADLQLGVALPLREGLEARLAFDYVRYWSNLHTEPGDTYVAGGAQDQFLNAALGIAACF